MSWTPNDIITALWLDAADEASFTKDGAGAVSQWNDKSGNDRHAVQTTASLQPTYQQLREFPCVTTDPGLLTIPNSTSLFNFLHQSQGEVYVVADFPSDSASLSIICGNNRTSSGGTGFFIGSDSRASIDGVKPAHHVSITLGVSSNFVAQTKGSSSFYGGYQEAFEYNTTEVFLTRLTPSAPIADRIAFNSFDTGFYAFNEETSSPSSSDAGANLQIGAAGEDVIAGSSNIREIIIVEGELSADDRIDMFGYLASKWGVLDRLLSYHPYRLSSVPDETAPVEGSLVSGVVQVNGVPARRTVRAFSYNDVNHTIDTKTVINSKSLGSSQSSIATGEYSIDLLDGFSDQVFVVAFDDYGSAFAPFQSVSVGDRIHPSIPNGHVWETTGAGSLPAEEPEWTVDTETSQLYGSASMIARAFYRPMAHGPIAPEAGAETGISAKHWRIYMTELGNPDATYGGMIAELEFQDADGVRLDTAGGIARASSEYGSSYPAEDAFDQQSGTAWLTPAQRTVPQWLAYEFSGPVTPKILGIQAGDNASRAARCPVSFLIEYSSDGVEWLVAGQVESAPAFAESEFRYYPF
jgi:hypothetical protein